jgi:hypothetical protein
LDIDPWGKHFFLEVLVTHNRKEFREKKIFSINQEQGVSHAERGQDWKMFDSREAVLVLWNHISILPRGHHLLANIEPLLSTIQALDPENQAYFYQSEAQSQIEQSTLSDGAKNWLELLRGIDYSARLLIRKGGSGFHI